MEMRSQGAAFPNGEYEIFFSGAVKDIPPFRATGVAGLEQRVHILALHQHPL